MTNYYWNDFGDKYRIGVGNIVNIGGHKMTVKNIQCHFLKESENSITIFSDQVGTKKLLFNKFLIELEKYKENKVHLISKKSGNIFTRLFGGKNPEYPYPNFDPKQYIADIDIELKSYDSDTFKRLKAQIETYL